MRPVLGSLASWIYSDQVLQTGVPERRLVAKAAEYLQGRRYTDPDAAEEAAERFIDFCRGRAWVFTDTGSTAVGDLMLRWAHGEISLIGPKPLVGG